MSEFISLQLDVKSLEKAIKGTSLNFDRILIKMQKAVNREVIKSAKKRFRSLFNAKNHNQYTLTNAGAENAAGKNAKPILQNFKNTKAREKGATWILNNAYYAGFLERGAKISAKKSKWLTFKVAGEWRKVQSVSIPARPFIKPAVDEFYSSAKSAAIMEQTLQKELEKYWSKQ